MKSAYDVLQLVMDSEVFISPSFLDFATLESFGTSGVVWGKRTTQHD